MEERLITDTSNFLGIDYGDLILIDGKRYKVMGYERERRFGMEDPKYWVKRVLDIETGEKKIIKLSFAETFKIQLGGVDIDRFRSPEKEGNILALVEGHPNFMQGKVLKDTKGNLIRVIDPVSGDNFFIHLGNIQLDHETYFRRELPGILRHLANAFKAIHFLHMNGFKHGDIRNDHIIIDRNSGEYVWIDFDYDYNTQENPFSLDIFGLGNILLYAIGKGFHTEQNIKEDITTYGDLRNRLENRDFSILHRRRFMNLRKLYPYIPDMMNDILAHFSMGAEIFYESVLEIIQDLNNCICSDFGRQGGRKL